MSAVCAGPSTAIRFATFLEARLRRRGRTGSQGATTCSDAWSWIRLLCASLMLVVLSACGDGGNGDPPAPTYAVGGTASGLAGELVLQNNGGDNLALSANGAYTFATTLAAGSAYNVTVLTQPAGQTCTVSNAAGNVDASNVANVDIACVNNPGPPTFTVGGTIAGLTGTLVLQNNGGGDLTLTANGAFSFAAALPGNAAYTVTVLTQPAGQTCQITNGAGNVGTANVTNVQVNCAAAGQPLMLAVTVNPDRVRPNEGVVSHLYVANRGASTISNIVLQARFPSVGVNSLSATLLTRGGTCTGGVCTRNELVTWNIGTLAAGEGTTVSMPMTVSNGTADATVISVAAEVLVGGTQAALGSASVTVDNDDVLELKLDQNKNAVAPGAPLTYTLTYANRSAASITGTTLTMPLPPDSSFVSASDGGTLTGNTVQWTLGTLQAGQSGRQQVVVTVGGGLPNGSLLQVDAAQLTGTSATTGAELARATAAARVRATSALGLTIEMDPDPVRSNEGVRTKLTITNLSGGALVGTQLQARFPTDAVNSVATSLFTGGAVCEGGVCTRSELVTWNLGTLAAGESTTVTLPITISNGTPSGTLVTLEAAVLADGASPTLASHTVAVDNDNALSLALEEDKDAVAPGAALTYTLTYANGSAASITGTTLALPLPPNSSFVSASGGGTLTGNTVQWALGTLQTSESGRQQVVVTVGAGLPNGSILQVDAAQLAGTSATTGQELARATAATRVRATSALGLAIEMDSDPLRSNETVRAKLTVTNLSGGTLLGAQLQARLPTDAVNSVATMLLTGGATCEGGVCTRSELVTWNLGTLAAGEGTTVMLPITISNGTPSGTLVTLEAAVLADGVLPALASHTVVVDNDNALSLVLAEDQDAVAPGATLTYTLTYANRSSASITGTTLALPLPPSLSFVSATDGGTVSGNTVQWTLATLPALSSGSVQVVGTVSSTASNGEILVVDAARMAGTSATTGPELARATAATRVDSSIPLGLQVSLSPSPVAMNQTVIATMTVTNTSGAGLLGVVLQARFPTDNVNSASQSTLTGGGTCPGGVCTRSEFATWNIGALAAGATVTVTMPMVISNGTPSGEFITVDAEVRSDAGDHAGSSDTARIQN